MVDSPDLAPYVDLLLAKDAENNKLIDLVENLQSGLKQYCIELEEKDKYIQDLEEAMQDLGQDLEDIQFRNASIQNENIALQQEIVNCQTALSSFQTEKYQTERQAELKMSQLLNSLALLEKQCAEHEQYIATLEDVVNEQDSKILDLLAAIQSAQDKDFSTPERIQHRFIRSGSAEEEKMEQEVVAVLQRQRSGSEDDDGLPSPITLKINRNLTKSRSNITTTPNQFSHSNPSSDSKVDRVFQATSQKFKSPNPTISPSNSNDDITSSFTSLEFKTGKLKESANGASSSNVAWQKKGKREMTIFGDQSVSWYADNDADDINENQTKLKSGNSIAPKDFALVEYFEDENTSIDNDIAVVKKNLWKEASWKYEQAQDFYAARPPIPPSVEANSFYESRKPAVVYNTGKMINVRSTAVCKQPSALPPPTVPPPLSRPTDKI